MAISPEEYLNSLPEERRREVAAMRELVLKNLPQGYEEICGRSGLQYVIPLERFPKTYNKQPLTYLMLAGHKNYNTLYMMGVYGRPGRE